MSRINSPSRINDTRVVYLGQEKLIGIDKFDSTLNLEIILSNLCLKICIEHEKQYLQRCLLLLFKKRVIYFVMSNLVKKAIFMRLMVSS